MIVHWTLTAFEAHGDALCEEYPLPGATADDLRPYVEAPADDPLYDCYPISGEALSELARRYSLSLPPAERAYFVECYADESLTPPSAPPRAPQPAA